MAIKPVVKPAVKTNKKVVAKKPAPKKVVDEEAVVEKKATAPKPKTKKAVVKKAPAKSESLFDKLVEEFGLVPLAKCVKKSDGYKEALPNNPNREAFNKACNVSIEEVPDEGITLWIYFPAKKDWVVKKSANLENSLKRLLG